MSDYVSPVAIYFLTLSEREKFLEYAVTEEVEKYMIQVDPDELKKALAYDRNQYQIGYENGKRDATKYAKWEINSNGYYPYCSNCLSEPPAGEMTDYCSKCGAYMKEDKEDA